MSSHLYHTISRTPLWVKGILIGLLTMCPTSIHAEEIFRALASNKNVESTYVSGRLAKNYKIWEGSMTRSSMKLPTGFSSLFSYRCHSKEAVDDGRKILDDYLKRNKNVELVMRTNDHSGDYQYYITYNDQDLPIQALIWNCMAPNDCEILVIDYSPEQVTPPSSSSGSTSTSSSSSSSRASSTSSTSNGYDLKEWLEVESSKNAQHALPQNTGRNLQGYTLEGDWSSYFPTQEQIDRIIENTDEESIRKYVEDTMRDYGGFSPDEIKNTSEIVLKNIKARQRSQRTKTKTERRTR